MQNVEQPPADPGDPPSRPGAPREDLQLLLDWSPDGDETTRTRIAAIATVVLHLFVFFGLGLVPRQEGYVPVPPTRPKVLTKLYDPPLRELTQKAPNKEKISKELAIQSPSPSVPVPSPGTGA